MSKASLSRVSDQTDSPAAYPADIQPAMQDALATLADIDFKYARQREQLAEWRADEGAKDRILRQIDAYHRTAREPYVRLLAELHQRVMALTGYSRLH